MIHHQYSYNKSINLYGKCFMNIKYDKEICYIYDTLLLPLITSTCYPLHCDLLIERNNCLIYFQSESPSHRSSNNKTPSKNNVQVNAILQATKIIKSQSSSPNPSYNRTTSATVSNVLKNSNNSNTTTPRKGKYNAQIFFQFYKWVGTTCRFIYLEMRSIDDDCMITKNTKEIARMVTKADDKIAFLLH